MYIITIVIGVNKEKEICVPSKEYISGHRGQRINVVAKCIVHIDITVELKA